MKKISKEEKDSLLQIIGEHIEKYRKVLTILLSILSLIVVIFIVFWIIDGNTTNVKAQLYLVSEILLLLLSLSIIYLLYLNKIGKVSTPGVAIIMHVFSLSLVTWGTYACVLDLSRGLSPIGYLILLAVIAGLFVTEPRILTVATIVSFAIIITIEEIFDYQYFNGEYKIEKIIMFTLSVGILMLIGYRHYNTTIKEYRGQKALEKLTYYDELTGLLNERSYLAEVDRLNEATAKNEPQKYAVVVMDVNNLKVTNDMYGHRYGCHLIVECGRILPSVFPSSKLFHVGGDEFIAFIYGDDLDNFDKRMEKFDETFEYSIVPFEDHELIFSVSRGYAVHQKGEAYKDVFLRADKAMYDNKVAIKAKYNMKSR